VEAEKEGIAVEPMNIGGTVAVAGVKFHMVPALHSAERGTPAGVVVEMDGKMIYHAGDTGLTYDMKLIGEIFKPDLSFLPIGDRYTMGAASAALAVDMIRTRKVIPIHYNTFPLINSDPQVFRNLVGNLAEVIILKPGQDYSLA
jgi:L-ascorbate metabolism protein UlaG (beta-lactamase superfamily)